MGVEHLREQWRRLASKDTAYRGVSLPLTAKQGEPILEALAKRQTNVAARLIIDAMAETVKNHWWSAGAQGSDEAGRWWSSNAREAREYSMSDEDAWMTLPVFMEASFEGADKAATGYNDGTYVWHLDSGHPVTITSFEAILPDDPQHLLDAWRGIISEGNYDAPGTRWDGVWTKLNIPPMRTTAFATNDIDEGKQTIRNVDTPDVGLHSSRDYYEREAWLRESGMPLGQIFASPSEATRYASSVLRDYGIQSNVEVQFVSMDGGDSAWVNDAGASLYYRPGLSARIRLGTPANIVRTEQTVLHELGHLILGTRQKKDGGHGAAFAAIHAELLSHYMGVGLRMY